MTNRIASTLAMAASLFFATVPTRVAAEAWILDNVNGYTWTVAGLKSFESLWIDADGRVVAAGDGVGWSPPVDARRVDGAGAVLLPGLIDAHGHVLGLGLAKMRVDLTGSISLDDALDRVRRFAAANPDSPWILGRGWNQELWPSKAFPTAADLDRVLPDRPVWLTRVDGHAGWANSEAMRIAGVSEVDTDPAGGLIHRYADGEATGIFVDSAEELIQRVVPEPTPADLEKALRLAVEELNRFGITSVHDAGVDAPGVTRYRMLADSGVLSVRVYVMLSGAEANLDAFNEPLLEYADGRLTVRSVKIYADGALGSRGAALLEPYADRSDHRGLLFVDQASLEKTLQRVNDKGFQAGVHAIGTAANRLVLDAFETVQKGKPSPHRNRIEHAQIVTLEDIPRFRELGIVASMQPIHATSDMNMAENRLGRERMTGAYAWRRFVDQGSVLAAGSDFPVESANPFHGIHAAVTRQDHAGEPAGGWYPGQTLTLAEALRAFTLDAAYAAHQEGTLGSLEPGKWADFIIVDRDPFATPSGDLFEIEVLETWLAGERVYAAAHQPER